MSLGTIGELQSGTTLPLSGRIRNLNVYPAGPGGLESTYSHEGAVPSKHQAVLYVNGEFSAVDTDQVSGASGLDEGTQNIQIIPQLTTQQISRVRFDDEHGTRVLLAWDAITGATIAGYNIYSYDGSTYTLVDTVTLRELIGAQLEFPHTGTGAGRISIPATPLPDTLNDTLTLEITGEGEAEWTIGSDTGTLTFARGTIAALPYNIIVQFEDEADTYHTGDTWSFVAGIVSNWTSPDLTPGDYQYAVSAYDIAGNESAKVLSQNYEIQALPDAVSPVESWNDITKELTISWTVPAGAAGVAVYHNFLPQEGEFTDYVSEIRATQTGATSITIPFGTAEGTLLYYVRPYTASGIELPDFTLHTAEIPGEIGALGTPVLTAEPNLVQQWNAAWTYPVQNNDALTHFTVHRVVHGASFDYDTDTVGTVTQAEPLPLFGYDVDFSFAMTGDTTPAGEIDIQVVAHGTGLTRFSNVVTITTYGSATITAPSSIAGGAV